MPDTSTKISGPIEVRSDNTERVAFDLMVIDYSNPKKEQSRDETYWLTLYSKCWKASHGHPLESVLKG